MRRRPHVIQIIAFGYLISPLFFIAQYFYFSRSSVMDASTWISLATLYKLSFIIVPPIIAYGIYRIRSWGWYLAMVHMFYILGNNTLAYLVGSRTPPLFILIFTGLTLAVLVTIVRNEIRAPYFNPRIRWWEHKPRYAIVLDVEMGNDRIRFQGETFNISEGGMFMASDADVHIDESFGAKLTRKGASEAVHCSGKIVWVNPEGMELPRGFGFVFQQIDKAGLAEIRRYIKDQKKALQEKAEIR